MRISRTRSKMKKLALTAFLCGLIFGFAGCGVINQVNPLGGSDNFKVVSSLWSDVPRMDGLTPSNVDFPAAGKLLLRAALGNIGLLNKEGQDRTTGNVDWLVFT